MNSHGSIVADVTIRGGTLVTPDGPHKADLAIEDGHIANIGPELSDLDLVGIAYQERAPAASVAVLRDRVTGKRYSVREGERAGRARVANIGPKTVTFTIDDYGTTRQVTLSLRKREDILP